MKVTNWLLGILVVAVLMNTLVLEMQRQISKESYFANQYDIAAARLLAVYDRDGIVGLNKEYCTVFSKTELALEKCNKKAVEPVKEFRNKNDEKEYLIANIIHERNQYLNAAPFKYKHIDILLWNEIYR